MPKRTSRSLWTSPESPASSSENLSGREFCSVVAFDLGVNQAEIFKSLDWLNTKEQYCPGLAAWLIDDGIIPEERLHPYQGTPHLVLREKRKQILIDLQKTVGLVNALSMMSPASPENEGRDDVSQLARLFDQLYRLEEERFYENQKWRPLEQQVEAETDFESRRNSRQQSIMDAARTIKAKYAAAIKNVAPDCLPLVTLGKRLARQLAEFREKSKLNTEHDSGWSARWITLAQKAVDQAADSFDQLKTLTVAEWVDSQSGVDHQILTLIEQVRHRLCDFPHATNRRLEICANTHLSRDQPAECDGQSVTTAQQADVHSANSVAPDRHLVRSHNFPEKSQRTEPPDPDGWEQMAKEKIVLFGEEIHLPHQQRLVLIRLLFDADVWLTAGDLALVEQRKDDLEYSAQAISTAVTKMEISLAKQLKVKFKKGLGNGLHRPVQRSSGEDRKARYRIDLPTIEKLIHETS